MRTTQEDMERPTNKKGAHDLYAKYMAMAFETRLKRDHALFDRYYQRAEHYLRLMNKMSDVSSTPSKLPLKKNRSGRGQKPGGDI